MSSAADSRKFDVVDILQTALSYVQHIRLMLLMLAFGILAGICYFLFATPIYSAKSLIFCQVFGSSVETSGLPTSNSGAGFMRSIINRLNSEQMKIGVARRLGLIGENGTYGDVLDHITVVRVGTMDAQYLNLEVQAYDPEVARAYGPALVEEFAHLQSSSWDQFRDDAIDRYARELKELEEKVEENQGELTKIEREKRFTEATIEQQSLLKIPSDIVETRERIARMDSIRATLKTYDEMAPSEERTLSILSLLSDYETDTEVDVGDVVRRSPTGESGAVVQANNREVVMPSEVDGIEPWRELERQKRLIETEIEEASKVYLPEHPKMKELVARLDQTKVAIETEMLVLRQKFDLEYERLTEKLAKLQERIPEYQELSAEFAKSARSFSSIDKTRAMWDQAREALAEKLTRLSFIDDVDWVQLQFEGHTTLRDQDPISPNKKKLVMLSLLLGLGGAVGLPTLLNLINTSASNIPQLEELLGMRGIGIVPLTDKETLESVHRSPAQGAVTPNFLLECFRVIRANIGLDSGLPDGHAPEVILVNSARPQEGKTILAANLAWAYHSMGERVLLVDCDLRRGRVHGLLQIDNGVGMSHMLTGEASPKEAILPTRQKGFDVIPRGPIVPGATELLCQEGFISILNEWRTHYDRVILDCPPILGLSESASLQRLADGCVLVVRSESTSRKDVRDAVDVLEKTGAHFFGFVLNGVDLSKTGNYYRYYYYSAPYYNQFEDEE